jgi:predicted Zn-dependent protease with MMP-like domain
MLEPTDEDFDRLISQAMDELPQEYIKGLDNVAIVYADTPDQYQAQKAGLRQGSILLGLYEGIPLTRRGAGYAMVLPDKITLFKHSLLMVSHSPESFFENIKRTLWHEIAHYYGLDHGRIHELEHKHFNADEPPAVV